MTKHILSEYKVQSFDIESSSSLSLSESFHMFASDNMSGKISDNQYNILFYQCTACSFSNSNKLFPVPVGLLSAKQRTRIQGEGRLRST